MQITWIKKDGATRLNIVTLGWAADPTMIVQGEESSDILCVYDYRDLSNRSELLDICREGLYDELHLTAWSYGVWISEFIFGDSEINFTSATAINGTPMPTDDSFGIRQKAFEITLEGIAKAGTEKFVRRMCAGMDIPITLRRSDNENVAELKALANWFKNQIDPTVKWTRAIVGMRDMIFPPKAQIAYWESRNTEIALYEKMAHYPDRIFRPEEVLGKN